MKLDLHIHSVHSRDAAGSPNEILQTCKRAGMQGLAITDHNAIAGSLEAASLGVAEGLLVLKGVEVTTTEGHVLAYGVRELIPRGLTIEETIEKIRDSGGIAVAAHPKRFPTGIGLKNAEAGDFSAIEVINGGSSGSSNRKAKLVAERRGLSQTGGSDAHRLSEIGRAYTVLEEVSTEDQVLDMIAKGKARAEGASTTARQGLVYSAETFVEWLKGGFSRL